MAKLENVIGIGALLLVAGILAVAWYKGRSYPARAPGNYGEE